MCGFLTLLLAVCPAEMEQLTNTWRHVEHFDLIFVRTVTSCCSVGEMMSGGKEPIYGGEMSSAEIIDRFMRLRVAWSKLFAARAFISLARSCNQQVRQVISNKHRSLQNTTTAYARRVPALMLYMQPLV